VKADREGNWKAELPAFPAGGLYKMTISGTNSIVLSSILVGDIWNCSGQSNMEWPLITTSNALPER
jgi:sialate O-acetylesterase